jgi:sulfatase modifying factor 1
MRYYRPSKSIMKTKLRSLFFALMLLVGVRLATAQGTHLFRISGPTATLITAFRSDGTMFWSNAPPGGTYAIQTVSSLTDGTNWVDYVQIPTTNGLNTNLLVAFNPPAGMTLIPAGSFTMGDTLDGEGNANPTVSANVSAFYMDVNLVSYSLWQSVFIWATNHGYGFVNSGTGRAANNPVYLLGWNDTVKWCNARSQMAGLNPVYYTDTNLTRIYTNGQVTPYANWTNNGYRLPTEAEWEKAARGGLIGRRFPWGDTIAESQANYDGKTNLYSYDLGPNGYNAAFTNGALFFLTSPVGYFAANGYGLYDMAGNLFEYCWDWYGTPYTGGSDPRGPASGNFRVFRGGNWNGDAYEARCAYRALNNPFDANNGRVGFRCVRGF